ncbi:MAG: RNA polymerase sigma factor [Planctomycetota bacterium]
MTAGIVKGDERAFNLFYKIYFPRLYRYLLVLTGGRDALARDVLQEAMIRILRHIKPFHDASSFWNWLRRVAKTAFIDEVRRRKNDPAGFPGGEQNVPWPCNPDESDAVLLDHLESCLDDLNDEDRTLIEEKYLEGRPTEALARERNTTAKAVESRLARLRKKLKRWMLERMRHEIGP